MAPAAGVLPGLGDVRVLVVEDEKIVAKDIEQTLTALGYTVCGLTAAASGAIALAEALSPDVVLMDIRLQGDGDGVEAADEIRERLDIPVVFLTAHADETTMARATAAGPYGYVLKPFDERELHVALLVAVSRHRAFAEVNQRVQQRAAEVARSETRYRQMAAVADVGLAALETRDTGAVMERAAQTIADTLGIDFVDVLELRPEGDAFVLRAGLGWDAGLVGTATVGTDRESQAGYTLLAAEPVVVEDLAAETRFTPSALLRQHQVKSGVTVLIHAPGRQETPYGVLGAHARTRRAFSDTDVYCLQAMANVIAVAVARTATEEQLRHADRLATDRARVADEERAARSTAEAANRAKDEFLAMLGHELRNPLGAISSAVGILQRTKTDDARSVRARDVMTRQLAHLTRVVDDLLDVGRVISGKIVLERRVIDVADILQRHVSTLEETQRLAHHAVTVRAEPAWVDGDPVRIEQIAGNILANALKYTAAGGRITVSVGRDGADAALVVEDTGIGIPEALLPRVFDVFVQGERSIDRAQGGLGIGLTLVRRLVELHGGSVEASSAGAGQGSRFVVRLPAVPAPLESRPAAGVVRRAARRVLIIEDNADAREMLRDLLDLDGHVVDEAEDGYAGLEIALERPPDIALIDIGLPGVDGYGLARRIRARAGRRIALVALTGYGLPEDQRRAREAGFDAHLVKPVTPERLSEVLEELIRSNPVGRSTS